RLREYASARRAERMTERDASAVGIDALAREASEVALHARLVHQEVLVLERLDMEQHLRGERFVNLPEIDVVETQALSREKPRYRERRRHQQPLDAEIDGGDLPVEEPRCGRSGGKPRESCSRSDPDSGRTVGERR